MIKIFIEKSLQMTEEDMERVKDIPMEQENITLGNGQVSTMFFKQDKEGNQYLFKFVIFTRK